MAARYKPGWKTSEFWGTLAVHAVNILNAIGVTHLADNNPIAKSIIAVATAIASALTQWSYNGSRAKVKAG